MEHEKPDIWFVYDGECPICQLGADLFKIKEHIGTLHTVDARSEQEHPVMVEVGNARLNLDYGMVIKYQDRLYQGEDALCLMAKIGTDKDFFNSLNATLFRSKMISKLCYPFMRGARNVALKLKGVGKIKNLE